MTVLHAIIEGVINGLGLVECPERIGPTRVVGDVRLVAIEANIESDRRAERGGDAALVGNKTIGGIDGNDVERGTVVVAVQINVIRQNGVGCGEIQKRVFRCAQVIIVRRAVVILRQGRRIHPDHSDGDLGGSLGQIV